MMDDKEMAILFDKAIEEGKSFEDAAKISGYANDLDEQGLEELKKISEFMKDLDNLLEKFKNNPELDKSLLIPLKEKCEEVFKTKRGIK